MSDEFIAHVRRNADGSWELHKLADHLAGTARLAGEFASGFGNETGEKRSDSGMTM
jgi:hypothetical protein